MSKGGSKQQEMKLPGWYTDMAKQQAARANVAANTGPPIWMGPDTAATSPLMQAFYGSVGNLGQSSGNMPAGGDPLGQFMRSMPAVQQGPGGVAGYSGFPMVQQNIEAVGEEYPGIWDALYELYPFLAPEGYEPTAGSQYAGGQQEQPNIADMTVSDLLAMLQNNYIDGGEGGVPGDQGAGEISTAQAAEMGFPDLAAIGDFFGETFGGSASAGTSAGQSSGSGNTPGEPGTGNGPGY